MATTYQLPFTVFKPSGKYYTTDTLDVSVPDNLAADKLFFEMHYHILPSAFEGKYPDMIIVICEEKTDDIIGWPYMRTPEKSEV